MTDIHRLYGPRADPPAEPNLVVIWYRVPGSAAWLPEIAWNAETPALCTQRLRKRYHGCETMTKRYVEMP